jgi:effector-binding domain-containing protein
MNLLKRISIVILVFVLIIVGVSLFLPSTFSLERKIIIDADKEQVFKQVNDLENWRNWSPWALKDPSIYGNDKNISQPSFGLGASFSWDSELSDVGAGYMKITESIKNEHIKNSVDFGMGDVATEWFFKDVEPGVEVAWSLTIDFGFNPFSKFFGLFMEGKVAPDYELGLKRLKAFSEDLPRIHKVDVVEKSLEKDIWFLSIRDTVSQREMNNIHGKSYSEINQFMNEINLTTDSPLMVVYHFWSDDKIDIEVGVPINDSSIVGNERIKLNRIKKTSVVFATHYGSYERLPETYFGINEWMRKNEVVITGPPWESYVTDPASEPNPKKWETVVYFPIE